jgi:hypothetical protein
VSGSPTSVTLPKPELQLASGFTGTMPRGPGRSAIAARVSFAATTETRGLIPGEHNPVF